MARFRLRFLLQEFDLPPGETILGRSPDCHVTIEDALVSRQHAKVVLRGDEAYLEDLGSRNGVRVNNRPVKGSQRLTDGDRIRIGTQELVFCRVTSNDLATKRTGFLRHCARCKTPYPEELGSCPHCGATDAAEEETLNGSNSERQNWTTQLLIEVVQRALALQRTTDAERLMRRAAANVDERFASGDTVERSLLDTVAICGARLSQLQENGHWLRWSLQLYDQIEATPPALVVEKIEALSGDERRRLEPVLQSLNLKLQQVPLETPDAQVLRARLLRLSQTSGGA